MLRGISIKVNKTTIITDTKNSPNIKTYLPTKKEDIAALSTADFTF